MKRILYFALPILAAGIFASRNSFVAHAGVAPPTEKAKVLVEKLKATDDLHRLLVPALVDTKVNSLVSADVEGLVIKIKKPLGSRVKAGEVVLYVKNQDPAFTYASVPVRAPIAGVISQISPALMTHVVRGDRLFTVMEPNALKITAEIPGAELAFIQPGTKGVFKLDLSDKDGIAVRVLGISPLVDARTGTAAAELEFLVGKDQKLALPAIGSVGHAIFEMSRGQVLLIPESALGYSDGKPSVKVIDSAGSVKRKSVELGEQKESFLVVKSGLEAGERLVVRANRTLKDGELVDIEPETSRN